ncbi:T-cell immunomodulatory protein [Brevipalpus obovatus]|uniref:T-cell immunomodulatory protein n=1 Tax=Brevipalpus obovatus TaxID=246614 RepID=UPI003D9E02B0
MTAYSVIVITFTICLVNLVSTLHAIRKIDGILAAFGDFDSDKNTDLFVITEKGQSFQIYHANNVNKPNFDKPKELLCKSPADELIVGLIPGDFRGKASMDVVMITRKQDKRKSDDTKDKHFYLYLINGNRTHLLCDHNNNVKDLSSFAKVRNQPLALDFNGDMKIDLLAEDEEGNRFIYFDIQGGSANKTLLGNGTDSNSRLRSPSSNAFIDLDGDFRTDLLIETTDRYEVWLHSAFPPPFKIKYTYPRPGKKRVGMSTFADFNADGVVDHIVPVCESDGNICSGSSLLFYDGSSKEWKLITESFANQNSSKPLVFALIQPPDHDTYEFQIPLKLRSADVDGDGFPDLIAVMRPMDGKSSDNTMYKVVVLQNVRNDSNPLGRSFVPRWFIENNSLEKKYKPIMATFFDLGEDGKSDFMITYQDTDLQGFRISAVSNEQMIDACFLKVLVTSGLCYADCPTFDASALDPQSLAVPYGTNQPGPAILYQLIDTDGKTRRGFTGQLSQSADFSLQTPYVIFGLGQMPNFVDNLTASIPATLNNNLRVASWLQIVPDAQVVVIPYPPEHPSMWRTKLFITPSDIVISTLITLACTCLILLIIIILLHRKESQEDMAEHREFMRHWPESR